MINTNAARPLNRSCGPRNQCVTAPPAGTTTPSSKKRHGHTAATRSSTKKNLRAQRGGNLHLSDKLVTRASSGRRQQMLPDIRPGNLVETAGTAALTGKMSKVIRPQCSSNRHRQIARAGLHRRSTQKLVGHQLHRRQHHRCSERRPSRARLSYRHRIFEANNLIHGRRTVCLKTQRISSAQGGNAASQHQCWAVRSAHRRPSRNTQVP